MSATERYRRGSPARSLLGAEDGETPFASLPVGEKRGRMVWRPVMPREHGGWVILLVPLVVGTLVAPVGRIWGLLFSASAFLVYLSHHPLSLAVRGWARRKRGGIVSRRWLFWAGIYLAAAGITISVLFLRRLGWQLPALCSLAVAFSLGHLCYISRRKERTVGGELWGIAGLSLGAPAAYFAATGSLDRVALFLWLGNFLHFGGSVFYVKMKVALRDGIDELWGLKDRISLTKGALLSSLIPPIAAGISAVYEYVPALLPAAFLPALFKSLWGVFRVRPPASMKRVGIVETIFAAAFAALFVLTYRLEPSIP
ncbi:MAG: YwiC-like family protein [bacterium]